MSSSPSYALPPAGPGERLRVAAVQMNSRDDKAANLDAALGLIDRAAGAGVRLVALPEVWTYLGPAEGERVNAEIRASRQAESRRVFAALDPADRRDLARILTRLRADGPSAAP